MPRKGWFKIKGVQDGDRTLKQQILGLDGALAACPGKTVLDLGCAEGLIAKVFAKRGAAAVTGVEAVQANAAEARRQCAGKPVRIICADLNHRYPDGDYDLTLMLAILHKLRDPCRVAAAYAACTRELLVVRLPPATPAFVLDARSGMVRHEVGQAIEAQGFRLDAVTVGPFDEWMGYYRRARQLRNEA